MAAGAINLTTADSLLYTACEIRCAVATCNLVKRLGSEDPVGALRWASAAFAAIGPVHFVCELQRAEDEFARAPRSGRHHHCLAVLQDRLLCTEDPIGRLIARYAWTRPSDRVRSAKQPPFGMPLN